MRRSALTGSPRWSAKIATNERNFTPRTAIVDPSQTVRARVKLQMKLSDFGATVDVDPPPANLVVDATDDSGQTG